MGRPPKAWVLVAAGAIAAVAGITAIAWTAVGAASRSHDRARLVAYEEAIADHARRGGRVTEQEAKPSLRAFADGELDGETFAERAEAWARVMGQVKADFLAATPPGFLEEIEARWARALDTYIEAFGLFARAGRAGGAERERLLDEGIATADRADDLFDEASALLQAARRRLGLDPTPNFPDPELTGS